MTYPTLSVQVAFGDDPLATTWTWTDVTAYVKRVRVVLGRDRELDDFEAGRAIIVFDNTDRRFDPEHAAGPYFGDLLPSKRIRIRATHSAVTYTLFHGFVDDWPQDYSGAWTSDVVVPCTDAFGQLARATLPSSVYAAEVLADTPHAWWRCTEQGGTVWYDSSGNGRSASESSGISERPERVPLIVGDQEADSVVAVQNFLVTSTDMPVAPFTMEAWLKTPLVSGAASDFAMTLMRWSSGPSTLARVRVGSDTSTRFKRVQVINTTDETTDYVRTTSDTVNDGLIHHVVVRVSSSDVWTVYVDGVSIGTSTSGTVLAPNSVSANLIAGQATQQVIDGSTVPIDAEWRAGDLAMYGSSLSGTRVLAHYNAGVAPWDGDLTGQRIDNILDAIGWPAGLRLTDAGLTELGPAHLNSANALAYLRSTANAEQGQLYCAMNSNGDVTFLDRHTRLTATRSVTPQYVYSDEDTTGVVHYETIDLKRDGRDVINQVVVKWAGGEATSSNTASQTIYGLKSLSVDTELGSRIEAENLGEWIMGRYSVPIARCRGLTIDAAVNADTMTAALDSRINDRVSIRRLPNNVGSAIELDVIVEGIEHNIDSGVNTWTTTLRTSQADAGPWWIPDVGIPDTSTRPAW